MLHMGRLRTPRLLAHTSAGGSNPCSPRSVWEGEKNLQREDACRLDSGEATITSGRLEHSSRHSGDGCCGNSSQQRHLCLKEVLHVWADGCMSKYLRASQLPGDQRKNQ